MAAAIGTTTARQSTAIWRGLKPSRDDVMLDMEVDAHETGHLKGLQVAFNHPLPFPVGEEVGTGHQSFIILAAT